MRGLRRELNLLEDSDLGIGNKKEIKNMAEFVKKNNNGKRNFNNNGKNGNKKSNNYNASKTVNKMKNPTQNHGIVAPKDNFKGLIEYKMGKEMAENILKDAKGKGNPQEILCDYVNTQCGLMGYCVKVLIN
jgi:hypothetical protein